HGKWLTDNLIDEIFSMWVKYRPRCIKVEETAFVRGLKPTILREQEKRGIYPIFDYIKRPTNLKKVERIKGLQPWYKSGEILFLKDLASREALRNELNQFPKYKHDDILDTLRDFFEGKEYLGRNMVRPSIEQMVENGVQIPLWNPFEEETRSRDTSCDMTGGL